ncbi:MAG: hypothetical protein PHZ04_02660 [Patescibacteria group bacterium]|nr:hypothetical protein [Patescibacteria group bacterium]
MLVSRFHLLETEIRLAEKLGIKKFMPCGSAGIKVGKIAEKKADVYINTSGKFLDKGGFRVMAEGFVTGCPSCEQFKDKTLDQIGQEVEIISSGSVMIGGKGGKEYIWIVIPSGKKCVKKHYIFTVINCHVGAKEVEARAVLTAQAIRVAAEIFGTDFRAVVNFGGASTRDHFHAQIMQAGKEESLPRVVANIPEVIAGVQREFNLPEAVAQALLAGIMQKSKK